MSISNSHSWISHHLYNQFPSVENARISIDESSQIAVTNKLATIIPKLLGRIGTTLTHHHWLINEGEIVIGSIQDGKLFSNPRNRTDTTCPTSWVVIGETLLATEGIDNPSKEVVEIAKRTQENASKILPYLPLDPSKRFSNLSVAIDPRITLHTDTKHFVEKSQQGVSIVSPIAEKESESLEKQAIMTYVSMDSPQTEEGFAPTRHQFCMQECIKDEEDGYHECYHAF